MFEKLYMYKQNKRQSLAKKKQKNKKKKQKHVVIDSSY